MLRNDHDAQDALQSTFASALAALQAGKRNAPFRPWLFRIAHNEAITVIRRRRDAGQEISDSVLGSTASASEEADNRARMALLMADLAQLPERQRAALLMRELNGLSHAEISVALATSATAAKQAIFDARTALTEFAEGRALACEEVRRTISERDGRVLREPAGPLALCATAPAAPHLPPRSPSAGRICGRSCRCCLPPLPPRCSHASEEARRRGTAAPVAPGRPGSWVRRRLRPRPRSARPWSSRPPPGSVLCLSAPLRVRRAGTRSLVIQPCRRRSAPPAVIGRQLPPRPRRHGRSSDRPPATVTRTRRRHAPAPAPANHAATTIQPGAAAPQAVAPSQPVGSPAPAHASARQECATARQERDVARQEQRSARPQQGRGSAISRCGVRRHRQDEAQTRPARPGRDRRQVRRRSPGHLKSESHAK